MNIPLIKPYMTQAIKDRVNAVLDSGYLTEGAVTHDLEQAFATYCNTKYAIAVTSCTTGLELALRAAGIGVGDEVIVPDYTYPATASAVSIVGATPVIVDVESDTMLICRTAVESAITAKTKAIIPVSLFGNPLEYTWLNELKEKYNLVIIEDAACSMGTQWQSHMVGSMADMTVFSLHPRKFITTGEGGMITTDNHAFATWMESYKHFGMDMCSDVRENVHFVRMGTNYKLSNVQAAIGLGQMQDIDILLAERRALAQKYCELLIDVQGVYLPVITEHGMHSWQTFSIGVANRDHIMKTLRARGIEVQIGTYSLHMHKAFQGHECRLHSPFSSSKIVYARTLALPLYYGMNEADQLVVVNGISDLLK